MQESARAERGEETFFNSLGRRKALKGKAQERRELKEASTGWKADISHREGSQTLRVGLLGSGAILPRRFLKRGVKRRVFQS